MMNKMRKMKNKKGFTLMEMLIVVAIIAILIAIAIPTFASSLNKARVATDEANIRSGYAEVMTEVLLGNFDVEDVSGSTETYYLQKVAYLRIIQLTIFTSARVLRAAMLKLPVRQLQSGARIQL